MELQGAKGGVPRRAEGRKDRIRDLEPKAGRTLPSQDAPMTGLALPEERGGSPSS